MGKVKRIELLWQLLPRVTSGSGLRKFQADGLLFDRGCGTVCITKTHVATHRPVSRPPTKIRDAICGRQIVTEAFVCKCKCLAGLLFIIYCLYQQMHILLLLLLLVFGPLGRSGQRPEFSQATGMALVRCILDKFLGVACHCFPPLFF